MRRWIAGAAAGLGLLLAAPVIAQDSVPSSYAGSRLTTPTTTQSASSSITAVFVRAGAVPGGNFTVDTFVSAPAGLPSGCPGPAESRLVTAVSSGGGNNWNTAAVLNTPCNGTFSFRVVATLDRTLQADDVATLRGNLTVAAPPPEVSGVEAKLSGSTVVVTWREVSNAPPDLTGYVVQRQTPGGDYVTIATLGPSATTYTDQSLPPEGGETVYRVLATRPGPNGDITSAGGGRSNPVDLPVVTTTTTPGDTTGGATDGATAGTGGTSGTGADGGATTGGTTGTTTPTRRGGVATRGRTGIGTRAPRLGLDTGNSSGLLINPPDEGFDEEIDYGDQELAGEEASGDDLLVFDEEGGRGLAVPIGIGAVLFGWGLHLFMLARAARPTVMAVPVDDTYGYGYGYDDPYEDVYGAGHGGSGTYGYSSTYSSSSYYDDDGW